MRHAPPARCRARSRRRPGRTSGRTPPPRARRRRSWRTPCWARSTSRTAGAACRGGRRRPPARCHPARRRRSCRRRPAASVSVLTPATLPCGRAPVQTDVRIRNAAETDAQPPGHVGAGGQLGVGRVVDGDQRQPVRGRHRHLRRPHAPAQQLGRALHAAPAPADVQQRADQAAHHRVAERVGATPRPITTPSRHGVQAGAAARGSVVAPSRRWQNAAKSCSPEQQRGRGVASRRRPAACGQRQRVAGAQRLAPRTARSVTR